MAVREFIICYKEYSLMPNKWQEAVFSQEWPYESGFPEQIIEQYLEDTPKCFVVKFYIKYDAKTSTDDQLRFKAQENARSVLKQHLPGAVVL